MQSLKRWLLDFCPQHFVVCLGLFGLGNIWNVVGFPQVSHFAVAVYLVTLVILVLRAILDVDAFVEDWKETGGIIAYLLGALDGCFLAKFVADYMHPFAGIMIWCIAMSFTLLFVVLFTHMTFKDGFDWDKIIPPMFLVYCSFGIGAIVAPDLGLVLCGRVVAVLSVLGLVIVHPLVLIRVLTRPLPDLLKPTLMLFEAAPCMNMVAWVNNFGTDDVLIPVTLVTVGQIGFACLVFKAPMLVSLPFNKNFGAFTFPLAIGAMSVYYLAENFYTGMPQFLLFALYWLEMLVALIVIVCVLAAFVVQDWRDLRNKPESVKEAP